jgi:hypothetical protein
MKVVSSRKIVQARRGKVGWLKPKTTTKRAGLRACPFCLGVRMAEIQTVQTGFRVETHIRGRIYRPGVQRVQTVRARSQTRAMARRRICLLSARDARWLEEFAVSQPCTGPGCHHSHHTRREVERMVAAGILRWVGKSQNVACWPEDLRWMSRRSQGYAAMQLVDLGAMPDQRHLARISKAAN